MKLPQVQYLDTVVGTRPCDHATTSSCSLLNSGRCHRFSSSPRMVEIPVRNRYRYAQCKLCIVQAYGAAGDMAVGGVAMKGIFASFVRHFAHSVPLDVEVLPPSSGTPVQRYRQRHRCYITSAPPPPPPQSHPPPPPTPPPLPSPGEGGFPQSGSSQVQIGSWSWVSRGVGMGYPTGLSFEHGLHCCSSCPLVSVP